MDAIVNIQGILINKFSNTMKFFTLDVGTDILKV